MAFPKLLQKLFDNDGGGSRLNRSIMPAEMVGVDAQSFTDDQKQQGRTNLGAVSQSDVDASNAAQDALLKKWALDQMFLAQDVTYDRKKLMKTSQSYITVFAGTKVEINGGIYESTTDTVLQLSDLATAANRAGKNYYVYACVPTSGTAPVFVLSANSTVPSGYTAETSRKIGGFHCLCLSVGTINNKDIITGATRAHKLSGYVTGDALPASVWDLKHRPKGDPEGYVYVGPEVGCDIWISIYGLSWDGSKLVSAYGGTWADGTSTKKWHGDAHLEQMMRQNGRLPWRHEFQMAGMGSPWGTNIYGSADPGTTGAHKDTASRRIISDYGCEDMTGVLWQWLMDLGFAGGSGWTDSAYASGVDAVREGQCYGNVFRLLAGAHWGHGASCGRRAAVCDCVSSRVVANLGGRGASEPLVRDALRHLA